MFRKLGSVSERVLMLIDLEKGARSDFKNLRLEAEPETFSLEPETAKDRCQPRLSTVVTLSPDPAAGEILSTKARQRRIGARKIKSIDR